MDIELFDEPAEVIIRRESAKPKYTLWRFYSKANKLLYISQKPNPAILMNKEWWFDTNYIKLQHFSSYDDLIDAKAVAIDSEDPAWNTMGRKIDG
jgi:hypothetical protein